MSIQLLGNYGYFTRQGAFIGEYNRVAPFYGTALDEGFQTIWSQFATSDQLAVQNLPGVVETFRATDSTYLATLIQDGQLASQLQANRDAPLVPYTFQRSLQVVAAQMVSDGDSINRPTLTSTVTPDAGNLGDATVVTTTVNQFGDPLDMIFTEDITLTCNTDPGQTSYRGTLTVVGETALASNSPYWPGGSGASTSLTVADGNVTGIVTDGGFNNWVTNEPQNWEIIDGDAGVTVFRSASGGLRTLDAAQLTSDGSQPTQLAQEISVAVNTVYCVSVYAKVSGADGTGIFIMSLTDGDGNILTDDAGSSLSFTQDLNGEVTTSYQCFTAFFSTPRQLPTTVQVQYGYSTAPANGISLFLSLANVTQATQAYTGGPYIAAVSGETRTALGDQYVIAYTNSLGSQSFARGMDRLYGMRQLGVYFPSSITPSVPDNLVTH